jgi:hypothetical protein
VKAGFFLLQAQPANPDIMSLHGRLLAPGERHILAAEAMRTTAMCGPDPECQVQVWAVWEGQRSGFGLGDHKFVAMKIG